jgi:hypothetical protein
MAAFQLSLRIKKDNNCLTVLPTLQRIIFSAGKSFWLNLVIYNPSLPWQIPESFTNSETEYPVLPLPDAQYLWEKRC